MNRKLVVIVFAVCFLAKLGFGQSRVYHPIAEKFRCISSFTERCDEREIGTGCWCENQVPAVELTERNFVYVFQIENEGTEARQILDSLVIPHTLSTIQLSGRADLATAVAISDFNVDVASAAFLANGLTFESLDIFEIGTPGAVILSTSEDVNVARTALDNAGLFASSSVGGKLGIITVDSSELQMARRILSDIDIGIVKTISPFDSPVLKDGFRVIPDNLLEIRAGGFEVGGTEGAGTLFTTEEPIFVEDTFDTDLVSFSIDSASSQDFQVTFGAPLKWDLGSTRIEVFADRNSVFWRWRSGNHTSW